MESLGLLVGHLVGDFIFQEDWQAANKSNPYPDPLLYNDGINTAQERIDELVRWHGQYHRWWDGHLACTVHCLLYTFAVWIFSGWWLPWWGLLVVFLTHWPIDRFRLARVWMDHVSNQRAFATGPLAPWSVVVADQTFHLLVLFLIGLAAR